MRFSSADKDRGELSPRLMWTMTDADDSPFDGSVGQVGNGKAAELNPSQKVMQPWQH